MNRLRLAVLASIGLILVVVGLSLWASYRGRKPPEEVNLPRIAIEGADSRMEKVRFVEEKQGRKTWELEAKAMQQFQGQDVMILEDVVLTYYNKDGRIFTVSGKEGKVFQKTKDMEIKGDVVVTSSDGYRLKTNFMAYQHQEKKIHTQDTVELDGDQLWMKGKGLLVDMEARTVKVLREVRTQWKAGKKG
jgi:LPS export ABC transporter protein LptC